MSSSPPPSDRDTHVAAQCCEQVYFCPTSGETECPVHGGFDVCCDRPDLHRPVASAANTASDDARTIWRLADKARAEAAAMRRRAGELEDEAQRLDAVATGIARSAATVEWQRFDYEHGETIWQRECPDCDRGLLLAPARFCSRCGGGGYLTTTTDPVASAARSCRT